MTATSTPTTFDRYQASPPEIYEQYFVPPIGVPSATALVAAAVLQEGERVLDIACGTGVAARLAAERIGPSGSVKGIDGNASMLEVARSATPTDTGIEWHEASADGLPFPDDSFEVALCSLGLQFFADKRAALAEMQRVLATGGRVAVGVPGPAPPMFGELHDVLDEYLGTDVAAFIEAVFSFHDADRMKEMMTTAGFDDPDIRSRQLSLRLPAPADFFWQYMLGTPLAPAVRELDADTRGRLEADVVGRWKPFVENGALRSDVRLLIATARKSGQDDRERKATRS